MVTNPIEHPAILKVLTTISSQKISFDLVPVNEKGRVSVSEIESKIQEKTGLISVMLANKGALIAFLKASNSFKDFIASGKIISAPASI